MINAAMKTVVNEKSLINRDRFLNQWYGKPASWEPTELMIHVEGYGPRRIYVSRLTGRYWYQKNRRKVILTKADIGMIRKSCGTKLGAGVEGEE